MSNLKITLPEAVFDTPKRKELVAAVLPLLEAHIGPATPDREQESHRSGEIIALCLDVVAALSACGGPYSGSLVLKYANHIIGQWKSLLRLSNPQDTALASLLESMGFKVVQVD